MWRCFECGRYARKPRMTRTCAQTKTRSSTSVVVSSEKSPESAFDTGDQPAGHVFRSSAMRVACQRPSDVTIAAMSPRMRSASPRWLPSKRRGRWILRIENAREDADEHEAREDVDEERVPALVSSQPSGEPEESGFSRSRIAAVAMKIVGKRTRKPQKMKACTRPGTRRWSSLRCPSTIAVSLPIRTGAPTCAAPAFPAAPGGRGRGRADRTPSPRRRPRRRARPRRRRSRRCSASLTFLSSAEIAGTTSCRSPITA